MLPHFDEHRNIGGKAILVWSDAPAASPHASASVRANTDADGDSSDNADSPGMYATALHQLANAQEAVCPRRTECAQYWQLYISLPLEIHIVQ